jgi:galactose mutarotase-like enzyme
MKLSEQKLNQELSIETITTLQGDEVSFCPRRGGMITSLKLQGKEILYFDEVTFYDTQASVRGGMPILFPNAGIIPEGTQNSELSNLKRHGFARDMAWSFQKEERGFSESLVSNAETKKVFPYDFKLSLRGEFQDDGSFTVHQKIENLDTRDLPVSSGLHPYFKVGRSDKGNIQFDFPGGDVIKGNTDEWLNGGTVCIDNPSTPISITIPNLGVLVLQLSPEYEKIWVWSMPEKDFICIESVMRDEGGIVQSPCMIESGKSLELSFNIRLEEFIH